MNRISQGLGRESEHVSIMPRMAPDWETTAFETTTEKRAIVLSAPEVYAEVSNHGAEKAKYPLMKTVILTIMAGTYVGLGAASGLLVGGMMKQAPSNPDKTQVNVGVFRLVWGFVGLPLGFICIVNCGAELFTSMCLYMTTAWWDKKVTLLDTFRMYFISWIGNFVGCIAIAGLYWASDLFDNQDAYLMFMVEHKVQETWLNVFLRGIFANFLVCITTWMTNASLDFTGKVFAIWLPISSLAMTGYEHSIANMFYLMLALFQGADLSAKQVLWGNLIPATLGNMVGGCLCFASVYSFAYGKPDVKITRKRLY